MGLPLRIAAVLLASASLVAAAGGEKAPVPSPERLDALVRQLSSPDGYDVREAARRELLAAGAAAEAAVAGALGAPEARVRRSACEILGRIGSPAAAERVAGRLIDDDPDVREAAADALDRLGDAGRAAIGKARDAGTVPADVAAAALERSVRRAVESLLDRCISKDLGWGFYKDQFKDIAALGPPAVPVLLRLFTTPDADYVYTHTFDGEPDEVRVRYRKQVIHRLAGEALVDMKDPSVVPSLKAFLASLGAVDPLDERDPRQDYYESTIFALMRLGERESYERLKGVFLKASGASIRPDGVVELKMAPDLKACQQQFNALSRLAMLQIRADELEATERTYQAIIGQALAKQEEAARAVFDKDKDGTLSAKERKAMEEAVDAILRRAYAGPVTPALEAFWRQYLFYRGVLRGAYYNFACALAQMNKKPEALDALQKAVRTGYEDADWIQRDRDLDSIKEEAEYKRLINELQRKKQREEERGG
jgi:HEAT repeat protein